MESGESGLEAGGELLFDHFQLLSKVLQSLLKIFGQGFSFSPFHVVHVFKRMLQDRKDLLPVRFYISRFFFGCNQVL